MDAPQSYKQTTVCVYGDTYPHKENLKKLGLIYDTKPEPHWFSVQRSSEEIEKIRRYCNQYGLEVAVESRMLNTPYMLKGDPYADL